DVEIEPYAGKLIVIEGTDGVGRSTHVALLRTWLESNGHAVLDTGMTRSILAGRGIKNARRGHTLGRLTMQLYYATDFADRLENQMMAALRAGFIVLTDTGAKEKETPRAELPAEVKSVATAVAKEIWKTAS